jgi:Membrane bound FAD containing D-sorbitol dehydrogenase
VNKHSDAFVLENRATAASPDRRELLTTLFAAVLANAVCWPRGGIAAEALPLGRDHFLELSAKLCAMQIKDESLADAIQNALVSQYAASEFKRAASILESAPSQHVDRLIAGSGLRDLAKSIVSVWYSGQVGTGEKARVLTYEEALAWPATGYAKPPGTCGEFGDWIAKPASASDLGHRP